jgi:hypothetical protein
MDSHAAGLQGVCATISQHMAIPPMALSNMIGTNRYLDQKKHAQSQYRHADKTILLNHQLQIPASMVFLLPITTSILLASKCQCSGPGGITAQTRLVVAGAPGNVPPYLTLLSMQRGTPVNSSHPKSGSLWFVENLPLSL